MIRWIAAFLLALAPMQAAHAMGSMPGEAFTLSPSDYRWTYQEVLHITNPEDGVTLSCNLFLPEPKVPGETFPALVMPNSWLMEEHEYWVQAKTFCEKGYIVLSYSARGWGQSEGVVNVGGRKDTSDITTLIDWLTANTPVAGVVKAPDGSVADDSDARIGMCGISLGGGLSLMGAAFDTRVKAVMAMVPWGDLVDSLYLNQSPKPVWVKVILVGMGEIAANLDPELSIITDQLFNHEHEAHFDTLLPWALERSPVNFLERFNDEDRDLAVCISTNLQDFLFTPNQMLRFYYGLNVKAKRIDFNRGIHATTEGSGLIGMPNIVWNRAYAWFDEHLKEMDTGIMDNPPISIDNKSSTDRHYLDHLYIKDINGTHLEGISRPPIDNDIVPEKRYLTHRPWYSYRGGLATQAGDGSDTISSGLVSGLTLGIPLLSSLLEAHTQFLNITASLPLSSRSKAIVFATERVGQTRTLVGTPTLSLTLTPSAQRVQLIAHLYTVDALGIGTLISHAPLVLVESDRLMPSAEPGMAKTYEFNFITTAANVPKGHRLAVAIDTFDISYSRPSDEGFDITFHYGEGSFLEIPWLQ
ncbi:CocE/NonD family hydrolase [Desulfoluna butyratoxydans]|uniref:Alpha/beta hydrolase fold n=1 Tax=Desulfoluna butyratoxydans TaxID=231438 RepID=A0A4U8YJG6_9BACT|nr:CocE/NonD family hydrolase [Desulfoluna butyratoxydans]VFQ43560.1 alpha/beta hydrolase fold [Desulfoluna butyratoxydans]